MSKKKDKLKAGLNNLFSSPPPASVTEPEPESAKTVAPVVETPEPAAPTAETASPQPSPKTPTSPAAKSKRAAADEAFDDDEIQLVVFKLTDEFYGVDISHVESIIKTQEITLVPHAHDFVEGVTNLRGTVVPVIDLRARFGMPRVANGKETRIIVVEHQNSMIGMVVDAVTEVLRISPRVIEAPSMFVAGPDAAFISGIAKLNGRLITLLDLAKVFLIQENAEKHGVKETV